jgi:hypothetical protein
MNALMRRAACFAFFGFSLAACMPEPPPTDEPPEPKAVAAEHTELRDAIQQPIDQAKAVEGMVEETAEKQRAEIDTATN